MKVPTRGVARPSTSLYTLAFLALAAPGGATAQEGGEASLLEARLPQMGGMAQTEALAIRERLSSPSGVAFSEEDARQHLVGALTTRQTLGRQQSVTVLDAEFQAERAQREIERLRAEARLAASTAQRRTAQLVAAILLALVLILLYGRHVAKGLQRELAKQVSARTAELSEANQRLSDLSLTDSLTGLRNRRYLFQTIESELAVSLRAYRDSGRTGDMPESSDLVFYLLDIDDFKSVNDEHGHAAGDRVLEQVARVLEETGRASDVVVRWGGEEFLILSRQVDRGGAAVFAQRVRDAVREHVFVAEEGVTLRRTCSVGFAPFPFVTRDPRAVSWDQVVRLADQAAYLAKRSGRDAWVGVHANDATPPEAVRGDAATLELLVAEGVLDVISSMDAETRRRLLGEPSRGARRNA